MNYKSYKEYGNVIVAQGLDYLWGVLDHEGNEIVSFGKTKDWQECAHKETLEGLPTQSPSLI